MSAHVRKLVQVHSKDQEERSKPGKPKPSTM